MSLTQFKSTASQLLQAMHDSGEAVVLTQNGSASAVVQDIDAYRRDQHALLMLKLIAQGESDIQRGDLIEQGDIFSELVGIPAIVTADSGGS